MADGVRIRWRIVCNLIRTREEQGTRDSYIVRIGTKNSIELIRMALMMGPDDRVIGPDHRPDGWCMKNVFMKKDKDK